MFNSLLIHALSKAEVLRLLAAARAESEEDWLMILVTFLHGLRVSEVVGCNYHRITKSGEKKHVYQRGLTGESVSGNTLIVRRLKGSLRTEQELVEHADPLLNERAAMIALAENRGKYQRLFPMTRATFWSRMKQYGKAAGLPGHLAHPHTLKHSIATLLVDLIGVPKTQAYLGHKSGASTLRYTKPTDAEVAAAARRALDL